MFDVCDRLDLIQAVIGTVVAEGPNKLYIGGLPSYMGDDGVKEILQARARARAHTHTEQTSPVHHAAAPHVCAAVRSRTLPRRRRQCQPYASFANSELCSQRHSRGQQAVV